MLDYPQIYDSTGKRLAILNQATDVIITDQIITDTNGQSTLTFNLPYDDPKLDLFDVEDQVQVAGMVFVIRTMQNGWDSQGTLKAQIYAEALWYDLAEYDPIQPVTMTGATAQSVLETLLATSDWTVGTVQINNTVEFVLTEVTNPLAAIMSLPSIFSGELQFDTVEKTVSLLTQVGEDNGLLYAYSKNLQSNQRTVDSRYLYTRMRAYGANDADGNPITISTANGGSDFIENYQWYDATGKSRKVKCYEQTNDQISDPTALKLWAVSVLSVLSMPRITYIMQVILDKKDGIPLIGDVVRVYDPKLKVTLASRLAQRTYNVLQPWLSTVQLSTALYSLTDQLTSQSQTTTQQINNVVQTSSAGLDLLNQVTTASGKLDLAKSEGRLPDSQCSVGPNTAFSSGYDPTQILTNLSKTGLQTLRTWLWGQNSGGGPDDHTEQSGGPDAIYFNPAVLNPVYASDGTLSENTVELLDAILQAIRSDIWQLKKDDETTAILRNWLSSNGLDNIYNPTVTDPANPGSTQALNNVLSNFEQRITGLGG
ncbi:phage tail spike protein [Sporolactobacillus kofuensis]|uniref:Phage tail spike protein n=1 Tax=Sporolactobacillus kofuensis TaxID=269672 RepID=A0ABW1WCI4_9BACL|nr:phage tail protein [Sporolactobacillus kofuensis]MCO7177010.1 phage tail protein [Sporolactobacillus kofuensis]